MSNSIVILIIITFIHVLADYFLQGSKMSKLKVLKLPYMVSHVGIYTLVFIILSPLALGLTFMQGLLFSLLNGFLHLIVDYIAGIFKRKYWQTDESKFIAAIGLDHAVHILLLIISYSLMFPEIINSDFFWS